MSDLVTPDYAWDWLARARGMIAVTAVDCAAKTDTLNALHAIERELDALFQERARLDFLERTKRKAWSGPNLRGVIDKAMREEAQ
jgi:hypothetical protein